MKKTVEDVDEQKDDKDELIDIVDDAEMDFEDEIQTEKDGKGEKTHVLQKHDTSGLDELPVGSTYRTKNVVVNDILEGIFDVNMLQKDMDIND